MHKNYKLIWFYAIYRTWPETERQAHSDKKLEVSGIAHYPNSVNDSGLSTGPGTPGSLSASVQQQYVFTSVLACQVKLTRIKLTLDMKTWAWHCISF